MYDYWWIIALAGIVFGGWIVSGLLPRRGVESPKYKVIERMRDFEIREYDDYLVAEVNVAGEAEGALIRGFRILLDFISGNNIGPSPSTLTVPGMAKPEKISMTTPVLQTSEEEEYVVAFVMPSKYSLETLPVPNNPMIRVRQIPKHLEAVHRFSGYARAGALERRTKELGEQLRAERIEPLSPFVLSQYDPPWTPPFMRRNEVSVKVEHHFMESTWSPPCTHTSSAARF